MRSIWLTILISLAGCRMGERQTGLLCHACSSDAECGGNPCFVDATGNHFCGAPCGTCGIGYTCRAIAGMASTMDSCFPDNLSCATSPIPNGDKTDAGPPNGADMSANGGDMAYKPACLAPSSTGVSNSGGKVDRLYFGFTGDTRPAHDFDHYDDALQTVINGIFSSMAQKGVQFAIDQGDHMEARDATSAANQMGDYLKAATLLGKPVFMTMGNHECAHSGTTDDCSVSCSSDYKCAAYLDALKSVSPNLYYRFDVQTQSGLAVFIVIADDAWNAAQKTWLTQQLTDADARAKYTIISRHHPENNTEHTFFSDIDDLVRSHKYSLYLTGHSHLYRRESGDPRAVVFGLGGAPFNSSQTWYGYGTVTQCPDDFLYVTLFDQATGNVEDSFAVPPQ